ncbi:MAG: sugar transferase, partial [Bryobacteraceae bacterium]
MTALAFAAAYETRSWLNLERNFFLDLPTRTLLLGFTLSVWLLVGLWLEVYDRLDAGAPRSILRDTFRQCGYGTICLVIFQFLIRLDLSRPFIALIAIYSWAFLCIFRLTAGNLVGMARRQFGALHYVMIAGVGDRARKLGADLERSAAYGIRLLGFLDDDAGSEGGRSIRLSQTYKVFPMDELRSILRNQVVDEIVFAVGSERLSGLEDAFLLCDEEGVRTRIAIDFFPHVNSKMHL